MSTIIVVQLETHITAVQKLEKKRRAKQSKGSYLATNREQEYFFIISSACLCFDV